VKERGLEKGMGRRGRGKEGGEAGEGRKGREKGRLAIPILVCFRRRWRRFHVVETTAVLLMSAGCFIP